MAWKVPRDWPGQAVFILGGGPSLRGFDVERLRGRGRVIAVNNAGLDLAPWADVLFYADRRWLEWNRNRIHLFRGRYMISRQVHDIDVGRYVHVLTYKPGKLAKEPAWIGGWCGGSCAINIAYHFGAAVIVLLGFDMRDYPLNRWREGNWHERGKGHMQPPVPNQRRHKFIPTLERMAPQLLEAGVTVLNANPRSGLRCFPFADIEDLLAMDDIARAEREKYLAVWQRPEYRKVSPGMLECERAFMVCGMKPGDSLIDFGSGPCRATKWFCDQGIDARGIDFAYNARETDVPFIEANLWELPDSVPVVDWGFCTDVMEHIPPAQVDAVLSAIAARTVDGCYFRIATRPDKLGPRLIGKPLHMTVKDGMWWRLQVEKHWQLVDVIEKNDRDIILLARP